MDLNWFECLIIGLVSGFTDVLPVSSQAHKAIFLKIFGVTGEPLLLRFAIHVAILGALYYGCHANVRRIMRQLKLAQIPKKRRKRPLDPKTIAEFKVLRVMVIPVILSLFLYSKTAEWNNRMNLTAVFLLLNGVILFLPNLLPTGNKDARSMSALEGLLIGMGGSVSVLPGVSAVGGAISVASACGAERTFALNLTYLMQMVLTIGLIGFDFAAVFAAGIGGLTFAVFLRYLIAAIAAFFGAYTGIKAMRMLAVNIGFSVFAFYSFGAALLSFLLYLMV